ncbi:MAG TPA: hypothetical protein DEA44_00735 [Firmicutes bacterium]|nr:hypothetical protein [Bacillota bacterium]
MPRLEYRQLNEAQGHPVLYVYDDIDAGEIAARFACDYFVKDRLVYEKTSCAIEMEAYVIYVLHDGEAEVFDTGNKDYAAIPRVRMELRQYAETAAFYPVRHVFEFNTNLEAALNLQGDFLWWMGKEWRKSSTEIDEDRKVYVYYAEPVAEGEFYG